MGIIDLNVSGNDREFNEFKQKNPKKLEERKSATDSFKVATNRSLHVKYQNNDISSCLFYIYYFILLP